ncbi:MAG: hypothetical protein ACM3Y9_13835 [Ignavibacteria bacterium]
MFDSPFAFCPKCEQMVLLDQTQRECKAEHACGDIACPLLKHFSGYDFKQQPAVNQKARRGRGHEPA